jgi:hypothetical protein
MASKTYTQVASDVFIGEKPSNAREAPTLRVQVSEHNRTGEQSLRICKGWFPNDGDEIAGTRFGFNIKLEDVPELKKCITAVMAQARKASKTNGK